MIQEVESRATTSAHQLTLVKSQLAAKQRDVRLLTLTASELSSSVGPDARVYEGVGRMFILESLADVIARLEREKGKGEMELKALKTKVTYLETTHENAKENLERMLGR